MELVYLWVDNFREFSDAGFNFSNSIKFKYDKNRNYISNQNINTELPIDFFGKQIISITGIVGKNGTGKSNVLELICMLLKGAKSSTSEDFLLITKEDRFKCYYSFSANKIFQSEFIPINFIEYHGKLNDLYVMFFSNVFDGREHNFSKDIIDVSVNKKYKIINDRDISDFSKQILFITSNTFKYLNIEVPKQIQIIEKKWNKKYFERRLRFLNKETIETINNFHNFLTKRLNSITYKNRFILLRQYFCCHNILFVLSKFHDYEIFLNDFNRLNDLKTEDVIQELIDETKKILKKVNTDKDYKELDKQIEFIESLKDEMKDIEIKYTREGKRKRVVGYYTFSINKKSISFIKKYTTLFSDKHIFELNWLGISSGHKAYLNMFASISYGLRYRKSNKNLLLCIDEGDLYLHPKWQTEFFNKLLEILPQMFKGNIQLILTSHSPFLLANLPKECLIVLNTDTNKPIINGTDFELNTFGGNLYDLYEQQFFLGDMRTSTFADRKIRDALTAIEKGNLTNDEKEEISKLVPCHL